jgi:hypothetical protein
MGVTMALQVTLLDVVQAVSETAPSDAEVVATVVHLTNSGIVHLCGTFRGARFDLDPVGMTAAALTGRVRVQSSSWRRRRRHQSAQLVRSTAVISRKPGKRRDCHASVVFFTPGDRCQHLEVCHPG